MNIEESKIVHYFMYIAYLFGYNANPDIRSKVVSYLEKIYNYSLSDVKKKVLVNDNLSIDNVNMFFRKCKYLEMTEGLLSNDEELDIRKGIYELARECANELNEKKMNISDENISVIKSVEILKKNALHNYVFINSIYGILYENGIFFEKNEELSEKYYTKNALWNDEFSILCLINKTIEDKKYERSYYWENIANKLGINIKMHSSLLSEESKRKIIEKAESDSVIHLLLLDDKASTKYDPLVYDPNLSEILYYGKFDLSEKKDLLFSQNSIDYSVISSLVFSENEYKVKNILYPFRIEEQEKVIRGIMSSNCPVILSCESKIILDLYSNFIDGYFSDNVVEDLDLSRFDVNTLSRESSRNNYLFQLFKKNETDYIVIKYHNLHEVKGVVLNLVLNLILNDDKHCNYYLQDLRVSLDKKNMINVIFSKDISSLDKGLVKRCNIITINKDNVDEKRTIVRTKFLIELSKKGIEFIDDYEGLIDLIIDRISIDNVCMVVEEIVSKIKNEDIQVLEESIKKNKNVKTIGF